MTSLINQDIRELVIIRLGALPANRKISIGSFGEFSRDQLIESVKRGDDLGKKIVEIELEFLRSLKEGFLR